MSGHATPGYCPFCSGQDLRPATGAGRWHCHACLRLFSVDLHGVVGPVTAGSRSDAPSRPQE